MSMGSNDTYASTLSELDANCDQPQKKRKGGPNFDKVWDYVIKGRQVNPGHYEAECHYCKKFWSRGKPCVLRAHLGIHCPDVPKDIRKYWRNKLVENNNTYTRDSQLQLQVNNHCDAMNSF